MFLWLLDVLQIDLNDKSVIILFAHTSSIAHSAISFSGIVTILNNKESNNIFFSVNISTFQITVFVLGNIFCAWYRYKSLN